MDFIQARNGFGKIAYYCADKTKDIIQYAQENRQLIESVLHQYGGILLRNFNIRSLSEFSQLTETMSPNLLDYINRSTPRTRIGKKIYTATEYPAHKHILFHNENSYSLDWPDILFFFCVIPPKAGGETPIADSRQVLKKINKTLVDKFSDKKVLYTRNYLSGIDLSWQEVFQTSDKKQVEMYCEKHHIDYIWHTAELDSLELTTKQICQAIVKHPMTLEEVWFNQAHLFHGSSLQPDEQATLFSLTKKDIMPRNAYYGDGGEIEKEEVKHILDVYESEKIVFQWQRGDVMILDNTLMAHARHPFCGERKIVISMANN